MSGRAVVLSMCLMGVVLGAIAFLFAPRVRLKPGEPERTPIVAVLPFENRSAQPELELLASSIAEAVTGALAASGRVETVAPETALLFKDVEGGLGRVAAELQASYVIAGSVDVAGVGESRAIRVDAYLYRAGVEEAIWAERLSWPESEAGSIASELAGRIGSSLATGSEAR